MPQQRWALSTLDSSFLLPSRLGLGRHLSCSSSLQPDASPCGPGFWVPGRALLQRPTLSSSPSGRNGKPIRRPHRWVSTFLLESEAVLGTLGACPQCPLIAVPPLNEQVASGQPSQPQLHISLHISSGQAASMATCPHPHPSALLSGTIISARNHQLLLECLHLTQWILFMKQAHHSIPGKMV